MIEDTGGMEDDLRMMEDDLGAIEDGLVAMEDDLGTEKCVQSCPCSI